MHFLPDVYVPCEVCGGKRYNRDTLEVKYKGKSIYDVLDMTVEEALKFFENVPAIARKIQTLYDVGLSYVKLGQPSTELSGGEAPKQLAQEIVDKLEVVTPGVETPVSRLSGGNVQKILVGREIASNPNVLMVAYPVRGLDINSSYTIYNLLNDQKKKGVAVICVGEDLDVLLELCDRILVLNGGRVSGIVDARSTTKEKLGLLMTGSGEEKQANE